MPLINCISELNWIARNGGGNAVESVEAIMIATGLMTYLQKEL